jgi:hypothetical protein
MLDINCDGIGDIIVGEPLSTAVPLIGTDVVGGAAYIYLGQPNGTYVATPYWNLTTTVSPLLGVNATALLGFSVAGARYVKGFVQGPRALVGGPSNALDFGIGLLNLGNTLSTTYNFVFDNNGLGKAYLFSFGTCNAPLPVRLLEFNRQTKDKTVLLDWTTVDEEKLNHFELERSGNGSEFKTIALVFGNGAQRNTYQYTDKQPLKGLNYYRLRMVDQNGEIRYSQIVTAWINEGTGTYIVVAPNPVVNNEINIRMAGLKPNTYQLQLNSISGQLILTKTVIVNDYDHSETIVPQGRIAPGIYTLNILDKDKYVKTIKVLVSQ